MRVALCALSALVSAPPTAHSAPNLIRVTEREPLALVVSAAKDTKLDIRLSELIDIASRIIETHTDFAPATSADHDAIIRCARKLSCIVRAVRRDYDRQRWVDAQGVLSPYQAHEASMRGSPYPKFVVYLAPFTDPTNRRNRLLGMLVDTDEALRVWHHAAREAPDWEEAVESEIKARAVKAISSVVDLNAERAQASLQSIVAVQFRGAFEADGHWEPYGEVDLETTVDGAAIELDGHPVGVTKAGPNRLIMVEPGSREIVVSHPDYTSFSGRVDVSTKARAQVSATLIAKASAPSRQIALWSGATVAAAGAVITTIGFVRGQGRSGVACPLTTGSSAEICGSGREWVTFSGGAPGGDPNPRGVLIAPLGLGLVGLGGATAVGALLGDDEDFPWIGLAAGIVLGAATYGVGVALDGKTAFKAEMQ